LEKVIRGVAGNGERDELGEWFLSGGNRGHFAAQKTNCENAKGKREQKKRGGLEMGRRLMGKK